MLRTLFLLLLAGLALAAPAEDLTVLITGDGRADRNPRPGMDEDGINVLVLKELVDATRKEKADALLFTGDLVSGYNRPEEFEAQLRAWMRHVQPLLENGVRVLPIRGNHDVGRANDGFAEQRLKLYRDLVARPCQVPDNGPPGEELLTFSLKMGNTLIVGLDQYVGTKTAVNVPWFEKVVSESHAAHVIPYAHEMAFTSGRHPDHMGGEGGDVAARDRFWKALGTHRVAWFFAGHDHLYDRMEVTPRAGGFPVMQIVAGTAGAPPYPSTDYFPGPKDAPLPGADVWQAKQRFHLGGTFGYALVQIRGATATLTYKARTVDGDYAGVDRWSYTR